MFDSVFVTPTLLPLPGELAAAFEGVAFQTKSLHCLLSTYRITAEGYLEEAYPGAEWKRVPDVHGYLTFYVGNNHLSPLAAPVAPGEWFEFLAKFTDGRLVALERIPMGGDPLLPSWPGVERNA